MCALDWRAARGRWCPGGRCAGRDRLRIAGGPGGGRPSHYPDTPGHFWRKSGIFRVILSVLSTGLAPKVGKGYRHARMVPALLRETCGTWRWRFVPGREGFTTRHCPAVRWQENKGIYP
jgi:hypothetical protein